MSQSPNNVIRSLDLIKQVISDIGVPMTGGDCGGDCANCPCSGQDTNPASKTSEQETSEPDDKC